MKFFLAIAFFSLVLTTAGLSQTMNNLVISIVRTSHNTESITGELFVNNKFICHTLELPWKGNESFVSSIPNGTYNAHLRYDKKDAWRIELDGVLNRSNVQIHIGNYPKEILGCVLVGDSVFNSANRLAGSSSAYERLKTSFYGSNDPLMSPNVNIQVKISNHPLPTKFIGSGQLWTFTYEDKGVWNWKIKSEWDSSQEMDKKITEHKRDLQYLIFNLSTTPGAKLRIPLKDGVGGMYLPDLKRWVDDVTFKREN